MNRFVAFVVLSGAFTLAACDGLSSAMTSHTDVLARAAGHELTVEQTTNMLAPTSIPAQAEVVDAVANLWIDYTLLAHAAAQDSTLSNVKLDDVVEPWFSEQLAGKLLEQEARADTALTEEQLREQFARDQPGAEVHARHILFMLPPDASPQVKDSVMNRARQVLEQARQPGADFAKLAAQHTEEPNGKERGGDLDWFPRERMVPQFSDAAFALEKGQVSDLVETPFGIHIIKIEDRRSPDFESQKDQFRIQLLQQRVGEAQEKYVTNLVESKQVEVQEGAIEVMRELARKPSAKLSGRAGQRALVRYTGGAYTANEFLRQVQQRPTQQRSQIVAASDDQLREYLRALGRQELLVAEAGAKGFETRPQERDSAMIEIRQQLRVAARESGLTPITPQAGETQNQALQRQVMEFMNRIINGQANVVPLGAIGFALREQYGSEIFERSVPVIVRRVEERRPAQPQPQFGPPGQPQQPPPTTTGGN